MEGKGWKERMEGKDGRERLEGKEREGGPPEEVLLDDEPGLELAQVGVDAAGVLGAQLRVAEVGRVHIGNALGQRLRLGSSFLLLRLDLRRSFLSLLTSFELL